MWLALILLLASAILTPPYFYFSEFGALSRYSWQNDQSWANFGSFIGGTVGTLISAAAFIAVYLTLRQQREALQRQDEELSEMKRQSKISRLENILNQATTNFDTQLKQTHTFSHIDPFTKSPIELSGKLESHLAGLTVINNRDLNAMYIFPMPLPDLQKIAATESIIENLRLPLAEFILTADIICSLLMDISNISTNDIAIKHYKHRHLITFLSLHEGNLTTENINKCFDFTAIIDAVDSNSPISEILKTL